MSAVLEGTLTSLLAFCRTFEEGSFTKAARALRVTPAAVSRSVARLEEALGATLFRRTTRNLRPSPEGAAYYAKCSAALALLEDAERDLAEGAGSTSGLVRLSVPTTYGLQVLLPGLAGFAARHPGIELEVQASNLNVDFMREGFDLAVRMGALDDTSLIARRLDEPTFGVFASPAYLKRRGAPRTIDELAVHETIGFVLPRTGRVLPWFFAAPTREVRPRTRVRCVEDPRAAVVLAVAGEGLVQTYHFMVRGELARKELTEVLKPHAGRTRPVSLIYPKGVALSKVTRQVIDEILRVARASRMAQGAPLGRHEPAHPHD
jgi:DNA-binding transcriptional LysR family regulator